MKKPSKFNIPTLTLGIGLGAIGLLGGYVQAADHQEAPGTSARVVADIGDYYAWHEGENLNLILTFGTFAPAGSTGSFDSDILYTFHFDTSATADGVSDLDILARFGQDDAGNWGIQISGIGDSPLEGPVESIINNGSMTVWSGVADDPFFFDQTGFRQTISTGTISFDPTRDDVAGANVTAIAIQLPIDSILPGGGAFQSWSTTGTL